MSNSKKVPVVYCNEVIDFLGVNSTPKSYTRGFTGQLFDDSKKIIHVACKLGLCTVKMIQYNGMNAVEVIKVVVPFNQEVQDLKTKKKGMYICNAYDIPIERMVYINYYCVSDFAEKLLSECGLNTNKGNYIGRTTKNLAKVLYSENATYTINMTYTEYLNLICETVPTAKKDGYNLGVIAERAILKAKKAFSDRHRKNDGYYNGKPTELKCNFSAELRQFLAVNGVGTATTEKTSGRSQSNFLVKYAPNKGYAVK